MNKEINEIINNLEQTLGWCDRITTGNLPHKIGNLKQCLVSTIELLKVLNIGWHPASEVPQINKKVVAITTNGKAQEEVYYDGNRYCWNGLTIKIKWWCYPPKEDKE